MKTAEEVAEEIVEEILFHKTYKNPLLEARDFVAKALTAFAEKRVNETLNNMPKNLLFARNEALEEAAKVVKNFCPPCGDTEELLEKIRALKDHS